MRGGTDATLDTKALKTIASEEMILFDVTSALNNGQGCPQKMEERISGQLEQGVNNGRYQC